MPENPLARVLIPVLSLTITLLVVGGVPIAAASPSNPGDRFASVPAPPGVTPALRATVAASHHLFRLGEPLAIAAARGDDKSRRPTFVVRLLAPLHDGRYHVIQFGAASGPGGGSFDAVTFVYDQDSNFNQTYV